MKKVKFWKNKLDSVGNSRENIEIVVKLDTSPSIVKIVQTAKVEIMLKELEQIIACTAASRAMT
jgi:hypothetical protein